MKNSTQSWIVLLVLVLALVLLGRGEKYVKVDGYLKKLGVTDQKWKDGINTADNCYAYAKEAPAKQAFTIRYPKYFWQSGRCYAFNIAAVPANPEFGDKDGNMSGCTNDTKTFPNCI